MRPRGCGEPGIICIWFIVAVVVMFCGMLRFRGGGCCGGGCCCCCCCSGGPPDVCALDISVCCKERFCAGPIFCAVVIFCGKLGGI